MLEITDFRGMLEMRDFRGMLEMTETLEDVGEDRL